LLSVLPMAGRASFARLTFVLVGMAACRRDTPPPPPMEMTLAAVAPLGRSATFSPAPRDPCPPEMAHVRGDYCPNAVETCLRWMDPPGTRFSEYRCAEYANPARCKGPRRSMDFCIDRDEYAPPGSDMPESQHSWNDAKAICEGLGKRVCLQSEWQFSCEGEEMRPYPYGFSRDSQACNADLTDIYEDGGKRIRDLRAPHGSHPACTSSFGVRDLSGNLEEFVTIDGSSPPRPAMMGAWWQPSRNHCRATQTAHDRFYHGRETGFRCCQDPNTP
jgi:sulfatase modifying factor 1